MAKVFYTLEEAAQKLGVDQDQVKAMSRDGKLQVYLDRDRMMFKCDKVDELAASGSAEDSSADSSAKTAGMTGTSFELQDSSASGSADALPADDSGLNLDATGESGIGMGSGLGATDGSGMNVFDSGEIEAVDEMAQTQMSGQGIDDDDDDLVLESVGSGSGLLDLTSESDDTSLGADLFEEFSSGDSGMDGALGSLGGTHPSESSLGAQASGALDHAHIPDDAAAMLGVPMGAPPVDAAWSGALAGLSVGALFDLLLALIVTIFAIASTTSSLSTMMAESIWMWVLILIFINLVFGGVGFFVGKMLDQ